MMILKLITKLSAIGACALLLSGCWYHYSYRHGPPIAGVSVSYTRYAPPRPRRVHIPPRPAPGAFWIDGHWRWSGVEYVWVSGYWERHPPQGRLWRSGRWVHTKRGWYWQPGRWN